MKKLNHLKTYENFETNEEFNPFKREDWKDVGSSIRKGTGFLTEEEEIEKGKQYVFTHPVRNRAYNKFLSESPLKADKYLQFWAKASGEINANPVWNEKIKDFEDRANYSWNTGPGGVLN